MRYSVASSRAAPMIAHSKPRPTTALEAIPDDGSCTTADLGKTLLGAKDTESYLHANVGMIRELDRVPHTLPCLTLILWVLRDTEREMSVERSVLIFQNISRLCSLD